MHLSPGDSGEAVGQLLRRLGAAGFIPDGGVSPAHYCLATEQAVRVFQEDRGLPVTGTCDDVTWAALVEAAWNLGDRVLRLRNPNLRGDDVAELQRLLSRLGFDCGRIDGIFGPLAAHAVGDFQLNAGLEMDGVCRTGTVDVLRRLSRQTGDGPGVAAVREAESLRAGKPLEGRRVVVGQFGGFAALSRPLCTALQNRGADLDETDDSDPTAQAAQANAFGAEVYVGLEASPDRIARITYYAVPAFESAGGRALAHLVERHLRDVVPRISVSGMRLPILRETKMPAVLLTLGPTELMVERADRIAEAVFLALTAWSA